MKTPRPYGLTRRGHKGLKLCNSCRHLFPREEMKLGYRGYKCRYCVEKGG